MIGLGIGLQKRDGGPFLIRVPSPLSDVRDFVNVFGVGWLLTNLTVNEGVVPDYEGTDVAAQTRSDATVGLHGLGRTGSALVSGVQYYADLVLKPDGRNFILFQISGAGINSYGIFDLDTNTIGDQLGLDSHDIQDLSDGWKFIRMVFTSPASALHACNLFHATSGSNYTMAGDTSKGFLLDRYVLSRS